MSRYAKLLPLVILLVGGLVAWQLVMHRPKAARQPAEIVFPQVEVMKVAPQSLRIPVHSQGTVQPGTEIQLSAEIAGRITRVSPAFAEGGFFSKGELLLQIDPSDYRLAITKAEAQVAGARQRLAKAEAEAEQARHDLQRIGRGTDTVSAYALRKPQLEEARAGLEAAKADLAVARLQFERTEIRAPFDGRVRKKQVDLGQYVTPGKVLADIFSIDIAELRIPLSDRQYALLDVPLRHRGDPALTGGPAVLLTAKFGGREYQWQGQIVRTEGVLDERNRLLYSVVEVKKPYAIDPAQPERPPLSVGMFVEAQIESREFPNSIALPRQALRPGDQVWLIDAEQRLHFRDVEVLHRGREQVYLRDGLKAGERVVLSPLDAVVEGMQLRIIEVDAESAT